MDSTDKKPYLAVAGPLAIVLGVTVLIGWLIGNFQWVQIVSGFAAMQPNTALCFVLCGAGLIAAARRHRLATLACGVAVASLSALTLAQYFFDANLGIDHVLLNPAMPVSTAYPGRMGTNTRSASC
jgi:hypothetical protein